MPENESYVFAPVGNGCYALLKTSDIELNAGPPNSIIKTEELTPTTDGLITRISKLSAQVERLRRERDEAVARHELQEQQRDDAIARAEFAEATKNAWREEFESERECRKRLNDSLVQVRDYNVSSIATLRNAVMALRSEDYNTLAAELEAVADAFDASLK